MGISKPIDDVIFDFKHIIRGGTKMVIGSVETLIQLARDNNSSIGQAMVKQEAQRQQITEAARPVSPTYFCLVPLYTSSGQRRYFQLAWQARGSGTEEERPPAPSLTAGYAHQTSEQEKVSDNKVIE